MRHRAGTRGPDLLNSSNEEPLTRATLIIARVGEAVEVGCYPDTKGVQSPINGVVRSKGVGG